MRLFVLLFLLTLHNISYAFTFGPTSNLSGPEFLPVDQAFQLSVSAPKDGKFTASWQINDDYYLYQEQFGLSGEHSNKLHFSPFPEGEAKQDPYYGEVIVYRDQLSLPIYYDINLPPGTQINAVLSYQGCAEKGLCYPPQKFPIQFTVPALSSSVEPALKDRQKPNTTQITDGDITPSEAQSVKQLLSSDNLWATVLGIFGLGLLLSFTPCVLPMVPIVSAIVVGTRHSRFGAFYYSIIYVLGMTLTYAVIGGFVGIFGAQLNLQAQLQNPILLIGSAVVFVLLALAMFDVYQLKLPSSWQQRLQRTSHQAGSALTSTLSIFVAGVLSTLIVSPCVSAPLAGTLLYISSQGDAWYGATMLFIMALGMGVPLLLVGLFGPKVLPKNGEWLQDIKVVMGFGLLAMAIWLLTRWLPISSHLYLWSLLALAISAYFIHRAYKTSSHPIRWFLALTFFLVGTLEFIGGASGSISPLHPLKKLSSPTAIEDEKVLFDATITSLSELDNLVTNHDPRPIVLDLYADWCISCRILEDMFALPELQSRLDKVQLIRVDVTKNSAENQALMQTFHLFGPPSLVFLHPNGEERKALTLMGEPSKQALTDRLDLVIRDTTQ